MTSLRWRRHRHLVALTLLALLILVVVFGDVRITAITSSERMASQAQLIHDIEGTVDLFDDSVLHEISIDFAPAEYAYLIEAYQQDEEKAYIEATVTIDGTTIAPVGLRLKGNSTLMGLREGGGFGGQGRSEPDSRFAECFPGMPGFGAPAATPGATPAASPVAGDVTSVAGMPSGPMVGPPGSPGPDDGGFGGFGQPISPDDPSTLPWLISLDEYVDGQRYQGYSDIAVRPVMTNESSLNEALALNMVAVAGEPSQEAAYAAVTLDDRDPVLRLIVGMPGEQFAADNFATDGVLYKSLATGSFDYLGDDPTLYETAFDQETARNHQDLKPLIDLLRWTSEATDEAFVAELGQHIDLASLARYSALQELLDNFDDMAGPGKNYYIWYDLDSRKSTVLTWDLNLALTEFPGGGPGGRGPGGPPSLDFNAMMDCVQMVAEREGIDDLNFPGGSRGAPRMGHPIKDRFLAAPEFQDLYAREYAAVYHALFGADQVAITELERLAEVVRSSGLIAPETLATEVAALRVRLETQAALGPRPVLDEAPGTPAAATPAIATPMARELGDS